MLDLIVISQKKKRILETKTITCGRQLSNGSGTIPRFENDLMYSIPKLDHSIMLSSVETTAFIWDLRYKYQDQVIQSDLFIP